MMYKIVKILGIVAAIYLFGDALLYFLEIWQSFGPQGVSPRYLLLMTVLGSWWILGAFGMSAIVLELIKPEDGAGALLGKFFGGLVAGYFIPTWMIQGWAFLVVFFS